MSNNYLSDLNKEQRRAVRHGTKRPQMIDRALLVIAGAGTGKTKTLTYRVAHLLVNGVDPQRILLLTFTRRAAQEMTRRAEGIAGKALKGRPVELPWSGTFHHVGLQLLREYANRIGLHPSFTIHSRGESEDLMGMVREQLGLAKSKSRFPRAETCLAIHSLAVNSKTPVKDVLASRFRAFIVCEPRLRQLFKAYRRAKRRQGVVDFDDLLLFWVKMLQEKRIAREIRSRFDHVLVDEYQDTNHLQGKILRGLKPDGRGVTVVGDDAQSIYSFRAATVRNIFDFPTQLTPKARVIKLERNYRSTQPILDACNAVMELATEGFARNLWSRRTTGPNPSLTTLADEEAQARYVAERILRACERGIPLNEQAVLFRASHHSALLELELVRRNIPFRKYGGIKFLEAAHIRDVLSVLRWRENPKDQIAAFRVLKLLPGIGAATATRMIETLGGRPAVGEAIAALKVPNAAVAAWSAFARLMKGLHEQRRRWPNEFKLVSDWYARHLPRLHDDLDARAADLDQLGQIASSYRSRQRFLAEVTLDPPDSTTGKIQSAQKDEDPLVLSTIHSAKGLEWRNVYVLNVIEECIPSFNAKNAAEIEEERRLLHVAMSRAKSRLELTVPRQAYRSRHRKRGNQSAFIKLTRFIPASIHGLFDVGTRVRKRPVRRT